MSSKFTQQLCDTVAREWWQREAELTKQAMDQLAKERMFPSSWGSGRQAVSPLGGVARPAADKEPG
jgi:hypothetical protein